MEHALRPSCAIVWTEVYGRGGQKGPSHVLIIISNASTGLGILRVSTGSWKWMPGQLAVPARVLICPQVEMTCHVWWWLHKSSLSECYTDGGIHSSDLLNSSLKMCLSLFLSLDLWSTWHGMAKTCPSLRKAIRCTPGWWWLCWTRTENGRRWAPFCMPCAGEGWKQGPQGC